MFERLTHDREADAVYVCFSDGPVAYTQEVHPDSTFVDYNSDGTVRGIEFLGVSRGVQVTGLPISADYLAFLFRHHGFQVAESTFVVSGTGVTFPTTITLGTTPEHASIQIATP